MKRKTTAGVGGRLTGEEVKIGYGRPPERTRFRPGVSGNPKGRPKWREDDRLTGLLGKEIFRPVRIQQNGSTTSMPALQIGIRRLMISAAKGDAQAVMATMKLAQYLEQALGVKKGKSPPMTSREQAERILAIIERARQRKQTKNVATLG